ncbi:MAG TPA: DUF92 domain-containing protein [bacterium]|nr:DUF92 domain-containing protein [bacterium]
MPLYDILFDAPVSDWLKFAGFFLGIFLFIFIAEKTRAALGWHAEVNRKLVHIGTGVLIFTCAFLFESKTPLIWMAVLFIGINFLGVRTGRLKGMHGTARHTYGTVFYPLAFLVLVLTCWEGHKVILMMSMLILAISDAMAAIVGENLKKPHEFILLKDKKSAEGSAVMFATTLLLFLAVLPRIAYLDNLTFPWWRALWIGLITAAVATAFEALSSAGSDNLTAPLGAAYMMYLMIGRPIGFNIQVTLGFFLALTVAVLSVRAKFLSPSGGVMTFLLGTLIFGAGGVAWTAPILVFFFSSSLLSKLGKRNKSRFQHLYEKTGTRDAGQVLANGGIAGLMVILNSFWNHPFWYALYLGAVAAVNADTWATEIGVFSRFKPRSVRTFRIVPHGTSGGITPLGTFASLCGSALIVVSGWLTAPGEFGVMPRAAWFWIIIAAGLAASLADSLLGATIQAQYRCVRCQKITEKPIHCGGKTALVNGCSRVNNDSVNLISSAVGAGLVWLLINGTVR